MAKKKNEQQNPNDQQGQEPQEREPHSIPKPTAELLSRICRQWHREIHDRQKQKFIRRSMKAIISTALIHIDRLETFAPIEPPANIKKYLKEANIFVLQGVFAETLLNLFTRFHECEETEE